MKACRHTCFHSVQPHLGHTTVICGAARSAGATVSRTSPPATKPDSSRGEPLLVLEDVIKSHDGENQLFKDVSTTVCRGDRLAVVGTNGSGGHAPCLSWHRSSVGLRTQQLACLSCFGVRLSTACLDTAGKTTLLRIMAGDEAADGGVVRRIEGVRVGFLKQDPEMDPG